MGAHGAIVVLAAVLAAPTEQAQEQPGRDRAVRVAGCIAQAPRTGSLTDDTGAGNVPSPNTAGVEANSSEPSNAYVLLDATPATDDGVQRQTEERTSYVLQGLTSELASHRGHRVEIVGQLLPRSTTASGPRSPAAGTQRIAVQTLKMLSNRCDPQPKPSR